MSVTKYLTMLVVLVGMVSFIGIGEAHAYCVANQSDSTIHVADFAVPNKKSLDNGDIAPGEVACKPANTLPIQVQSPMKRGIVSVNDHSTGSSYNCEVSPDGVVQYNGKNCYMKRGAYDFLDRAHNMYYNLN